MVKVTIPGYIEISEEEKEGWRNYCSNSEELVEEHTH